MCFLPAMAKRVGPDWVWNRHYAHITIVECGPEEFCEKMWNPHPKDLNFLGLGLG